jgi:branched-chain amino acid transport system substrate-binding protein
MSGTWAKALLSLCTILAIAGSVTLGAGPSFATGQAAPVRAGMRVRLCTSLPFTSIFGAMSHGIDNSVRLATEQWTQRFRAAHLELLPPISLDDGAAQGSDPALEEENAHACVRRQDTFGYVGPLNSGATFKSEPILNQAGMLQINPSNTIPTLTSPVTRQIFEPATYSRRLAYVTFYRTVTTDALQGPADATFMRETLHARDYFLVDDQFLYGSSVAETAHDYATRIGLRLAGKAHLDPKSPSSVAGSADAVAAIVAARQPDATLCGCDATQAAPFAAALRRQRYSGPFVGPDALESSDIFIKGAGTGAANSYASNVGLDPAGAPGAFRSAYRRRFHVPLQYFDALAYDAANIALNAMYQASTHGKLRGSLFRRRAAILPYVAHVRWHGAAGITTFDRNGDTRRRLVNMYAVRNGTWRLIGVAPPVHGVSPTG